MLHKAIFLATCNATMTTEKNASCRGGVTLSQYFSQLAGHQLEIIYISFFDRQLEISREEKTRYNWLIFTKLRFRLRWTCPSHAATCLETLRKVEDSSTFLATRNATFYYIAGCKNGVLHVKSSLQLATQRLL